MKKLIKDEIYFCEFHLIVCPLNKLNPTLTSHYKRKGEKYHPFKTNIDHEGYSLRVENEKGFVDRFIWIEEKIFKKSWKKAILILSHELNHQVDRVFDRIEMNKENDNRATTEARAYYYEYLLRQVLNYLYK